MLLGAALVTLGLAWPLFWLMHHSVVGLMLVGQLGFAVLLGLFFGAIPATMVGTFPARVRCSALAIAFNLCSGLLGGRRRWPSRRCWRGATTPWRRRIT